MSLHTSPLIHPAIFHKIVSSAMRAFAKLFTLVGMSLLSQLA